jgi:hypothetical protein
MNRNELDAESGLEESISGQPILSISISEHEANQTRWTDLDQLSTLQPLRWSSNREGEKRLAKQARVAPAEAEGQN